MKTIRVEPLRELQESPKGPKSPQRGPPRKPQESPKRRETLRPYTKLPQTNFVIIQCDGELILHHPHKDRDKPLKEDDATPPLDRNGLTRAFQLATDWNCSRKWPACLRNVFQAMVSCFEAHEHPHTSEAAFCSGK